MSDDLRDRLSEGDRRLPAGAGAVADLILANTCLVPELVSLLSDTNPAVVSHAAHAAMQISARDPSLFDAHVEPLIELTRALPQWEIGEQLPKVLVRCRLSPEQAERLADALKANVDSQYNIVAACSLQGLVDLALDERINAVVARSAVSRAMVSPKKALSARARKLRKTLDAATKHQHPD